MQTYYFTFGFNHLHPVKLISMRDYWIEIVAPNIDEATRIMNANYHDWANVYVEQQFLASGYKHYPKGCFEHYEF